MSLNDHKNPDTIDKNVYPPLPQENLYPTPDVSLDIASYPEDLTDKARELRIKFLNQWNNSVEIENEHFSCKTRNKDTLAIRRNKGRSFRMYKKTKGIHFE